MSVKNELINLFGLCSQNDMDGLDQDKLFAKSGISVIAALAGEGKTTKMLEYKRQWEREGYLVSYVNADSAPTYGAEMIESPLTRLDTKKMMTILEEHATEKDIIIIDSLKAFASFDGCSINSNEEMGLFMLALREIIKKTKCNIIFVHHVYRAKNIKAHVDSIAGARVIEEQSDSAFLFSFGNVEIVKSRLGYPRGAKINI